MLELIYIISMPLVFVVILLCRPLFRRRTEIKRMWFKRMR